MREYILENQKKVIIVSIFIVFTIVLSIIVANLNKKNNLTISNYVSNLKRSDIKLDNNTCDLDNILEYNNVPYFHLSNETYDSINEDILTNFLLRTCYENGDIDYEASLNNNILSVALRISYETSNELAYLEYKTYNVDINTNKKISNQEILNLYNLNKNDVENTVLSKLKEYYNYEVANKYIENKTFQQYLNLILEYDPITFDNMNLFIDSKNNLYVFKDYTLSEGMSIDKNFPYITVRFKLN